MIDIVTVTHNATNEALAQELLAALKTHEDEEEFTFYEHSNRQDNLGFAKGCNIGALVSGAEGEIIGFLNPDVIVEGPFIKHVETILNKENVVITGNRFNKSEKEIATWGVKDWVCGATFFVRRDFFEEVGGFDERYVWSWEETDLIRTAEKMGKRVVSVEYPFSHSSPTENSPKDSMFKNYFFEQGSKLFKRKWSSKP